jgi:glutamate N-acetyltransferase/amino-acid N-acetyltransferase
MSSGASGVRPTPADFSAALNEICRDLALQLLHDAEGAAHDITIVVQHAASEVDAVEVGRAIARSNLFKCAIFGGDPNWGRVLAAVGTTAAAFEPDRIDISLNGVQVCRDGAVGDPRELVDLRGRAVTVEVNLRNGKHDATIWTNDLTYDYVKENAEYAT